MRMSTVPQRLGAVIGLASAILLFTSGLINDIQVSPTSSSPTIADALTRNQTSILLGTYAAMMGAFFLIAFVAFLRHLLAQEFGDHWLLTAAFGGGLVAAGALLLAAHFSQAFTVLSQYGSETQVAKALYLLDWNWYLLVEAPPIAALIGGLSAFSLVTKALPRWLTLPGLLVAVLLLVPFVTGGGIMLSYLWLGALSVVIFTRSPATTATQH